MLLSTPTSTSLQFLTLLMIYVSFTNADHEPSQDGIRECLVPEYGNYDVASDVCYQSGEELTFKCKKDHLWDLKVQSITFKCVNGDWMKGKELYLSPTVPSTLQCRKVCKTSSKWNYTSEDSYKHGEQLTAHACKAGYSWTLTETPPLGPPGFITCLNGRWDWPNTESKLPECRKMCDSPMLMNYEVNERIYEDHFLHDSYEHGTALSLRCEGNTFPVHVDCKDGEWQHLVDTTTVNKLSPCYRP